MWALVNFYRWTPDSLRIVLAGGLPRHLPEVSADQAAAWVARLAADPAVSPRELKAMERAIASLVSATPTDPATMNGTTAPPSD